MSNDEKAKTPEKKKPKKKFWFTCGNVVEANSKKEATEIYKKNNT